MNKVRYGIIGMGVIGNLHARQITEAKDRSFELAAVADRDPKVAQAAGAKYGVASFDDGVKLLDSGLVDAVLISPPHYWHAPLAVAAAQRKIHVLVEKPMSVTVGDARTIIEQCKKHKVALASMLMQRTRAAMAKMKKLVDSGLVGEVHRVEMICSAWYRTQSYYDSAAWRGTWDGEGGGILINQAPHSLDLFQWIGGMPDRVTAVVNTRNHKIEVENVANIICQYPGDTKVGYIYATTCQLPGEEKLSVFGDKGVLVCEGAKLTHGKLTMSITDHLAKSGAANADTIPHPKCVWKEIKIPAKPDGRHINVTRNFAQHILKGEALIADGHEAIRELEISNAAYLSGFQGGTVSIPVDAKKMDALITKLQKDKSNGSGGDEQKKAAAMMKKLLKK